MVIHMTLQQMRYAVMVAEKQSFGKAALELFISQPSLSNAIHGLEDELGIELFIRTPKGVRASQNGHAFIDAAKRIIAQSDAVLNQYTKSASVLPIYFSVSSLRYAFAIRAFSRILAIIDSNHYDLRFRDVGCLQIIQDVVAQRSEVGILEIESGNKTTVNSFLKKNCLEFYLLYVTEPHFLLRSEHPLAHRASIQVVELAPYPFIGYDYDLQSCNDQMILTSNMPKTRIRSKDLSTLISMLRSTDGYAIGNGLFNDDLYLGLTAIPVEGAKEVQVGWIKLQDQPLSPLAEQYVEILKEEVAQAQKGPSE